ncbi:phosphatidylinositol 3,4,5-trisphosphate-dependent Rac exchanger 2 protein-like [Polypterus senegalus]|uniref:phosphatidylinositol 3,4,5-trisphosphate-dependent Rac exchanger 2 protein-like n=1 Tax=Polypterus senegalus TaxID=55291 RepID=UPI0019650420|nr:phosphatidylinositol 3,4,5-trisphosphate-dependent Rac exchanger 2 protein-like [Polypterus senegalus]
MTEDAVPDASLQAPKDLERQLRLRLCVLNEILKTERDYVENLLFLQSTGSNTTAWHFKAPILSFKGWPSSCHSPCQTCNTKSPLHKTN